MQEFLNNPVVLGLLIFGLFLTSGSVASKRLVTPGPCHHLAFMTT